MRAQIAVKAFSSSHHGQIALVGLWMVAVLAALAGLWAYKLEPGTQAELVAEWPADSHLATRPDRPTLVMFAHPRCPCTRASLSELRVLLSRFSDRMVTHVVFMRPAGTSSDWSKTDTWATAASLAGVQVVTDNDGREARLFGATTSGHVVLYDARHRLLFSGGITPARGHEGGSPQLDRLISLLERMGGRADPSPAAQLERPGAVYGCSLREKGP